MQGLRTIEDAHLRSLPNGQARLSRLFYRFAVPPRPEAGSRAAGASPAYTRVCPRHIPSLVAAGEAQLTWGRVRAASGRGQSGQAWPRPGRHCRVPAVSGQHASAPAPAVGAVRGGLRGGGSQLQPAGELAGEQRERLAGAPGDRPGLRAQRSVPARADPGRTRCHPSMRSRSVCLGCCGQLGKEMAWQGGSGQL